jgi:hypothetical protein
MDTAEIAVVVGAALLIGFILWFFFGAQGARRSDSADPSPPATKERRSI